MNLQETGCLAMTISSGSNPGSATFALMATIGFKR